MDAVQARKLLLERQKKWLKENLGIETYEQLVEELRRTPPIDIGIFVLPVEQTKAS